jgi:hypothetical protein
MLGDGGSGKAAVHVLELLGAHCSLVMSFTGMTRRAATHRTK